MDRDDKNRQGLENWAGQLACPVCFGALAVSEAEARCEGCGCVYPVVDGIAVLIGERAKAPAKL